MNKKIAFISPYIGFKHQEYLKDRFELLPKETIYIAFDQIKNGWTVDTARLFLIQPQKYIEKVVGKIHKAYRRFILGILGRRPFQTILPFGAVGKLEKILFQEKVDVLLIMYAGLAVSMADYLIKCDYPFYFTMEGSDVQMSERSRWFQKKLRKTWDGAEGIFTISNFLWDQAKDHNFPMKKCYLIYNGIRDIDSALIVKGGTATLRIGMVANFHPVKGHRLALNALAIFNKQFEEKFEVLLIGAGPELERCREMANKLGILKKIRFIGQIPGHKVLELISSCHIYLQTSVRGPLGEEEGLSISVLEAAALGIPSIVTRSGGLPETVVDGETGYICSPVPEDISNKILFLARQPLEFRSQMGMNASKRIQEEFKIETQINRWLERIMAIKS